MSALPSGAAAQETTDQRYVYVNYDEYWDDDRREGADWGDHDRHRDHDHHKKDDRHKGDRHKKDDRKKDDGKQDDGYKKPKPPTKPPKTPPATEQPEKPDHPEKPEKPEKPDHEKPELPVTGVGSLTVVGAGLLLVGFGILAWLVGNRRRAQV